MDTQRDFSKRHIRQRRRKPPLQLRLMRQAFSKFGPVFPDLFGKWAYKIWFSTRRFETPQREQSWMENARTEVIELASIPITTYQWGKETDPLVVLVHGWNGRGSQMAAFAERLVSAGMRVLTYDAPGHGQSPSNSTNIFTLSNVLTDIAEKVAPIHGIIGHSFGGMTASLAISYGLYTNKVVLISTPAHIDHLIKLFADGLSIPGVVEANLRKRLKDRFGENLFEGVSTVNTCRRLNNIPALIIHDKQDHDIPVEHARQIQAAWPNSRLFTTESLGHKRILYKRKVIEEAVAFLGRN